MRSDEDCRPCVSHCTGRMYGNLADNRKENNVRRLVFALAILVSVASSANAQSYFIGAKKIPGDPYVSSGCGSSWAICRYRVNLRRNGEYTYRRAHNGNWSPAYQKLQQRIARTCTPATVWKDACR